MKEFLPRNGGYRKLRVYRISQIVYDLTCVFVKRFVSPSSRTTDQMVQAARSGKQNIAEGSEASITSSETEIKLTNVAKASLEELLLDYEDYLRQNGFRQWDGGNERLRKLKAYLKSNEFMSNPLLLAERYSAEEFCNLCITLINQATYMLRHLLIYQQDKFVKEGGIKEKMYQARVEYRNGFQGKRASKVAFIMKPYGRVELVRRVEPVRLG